MKLIYKVFCVLFSASALFASCLGGDNDNEETYSDAAITAATLGTLNRYTTSKSSTTGNDTIVKTTLTGSTYKLTIDQLANRIFNLDSLPLGTDLKHVVITSLSTKNGGVALLKSATSDSIRYFSTTDSIDFSIPRIIRVISSDGSAQRDYTMTLAASESTGINFEWKLVAQSDELAGWTDKHLVAFADTIALVDNGTISVNSSIVGGSMLMRLNTEGMLLSVRNLKEMDNPAAWKEMASNPVSRLIGSTRHEMFALGTDGNLKVCPLGMANEHQGIKEGDGYTSVAIDGFYWRDEQLDDALSLLPTTSLALASWAYAPADSMDYVLLAGNSDADGSNAVVWRKLSRYHDLETTGYQDTEGSWIYMPVDDNNRYALPRMDGLSIVYYNGSVLAVDSNKQMLQSRDQGITWKPVSAYALPSTLQGSLLSMAADGKGRLWIVTDAGQVWQGALR